MWQQFYTTSLDEISLSIYLATLIAFDGSDRAVSEFDVKYRGVAAVVQSTTR